MYFVWHVSHWDRCFARWVSPPDVYWCVYTNVLTVVAGDDRCEPTSWRRHENTNVRGGRHRSSSSTLTQCQSTCVTDADCTGIDWNQASSHKCRHHGWWSTGNRRNYAPGTDHYRLTRNPQCSGIETLTVISVYTPSQYIRPITKTEQELQLSQTDHTSTMVGGSPAGSASD